MPWNPPGGGVGGSGKSGSPPRKSPKETCRASKPKAAPSSARTWLSLPPPANPNRPAPIAISCPARAR